MAVTNSGFDGAFSESKYAKMWAFGGAHDAVANDAAWKVTAGTGRQVSVAAGDAFAAGVLSESTAAQLKSIATPTNGQWFLVVRRIVWATNTVSIETIAHTTTSTTAPTVPPTTYPTVSNAPGTTYDQKLAWAWSNSANTTVSVFDLRQLPGRVDGQLALTGSVGAYGALELYKVGDVATLNFNVTGGSNDFSLSFMAATIPVGFRPVAQLMVPALAENGASLFAMNGALVGTDGRIFVNQLGAPSVRITGFSVSYKTAV